MLVCLELDWKGTSMLCKQGQDLDFHGERRSRLDTSLENFFK